MWRNLPGVVHRCLHVVVPRVQVFCEGLLFFFFFVVLPTRCLLNVFSLLGLTLRPSAPVCCCHQDSLTRGRLAFEQEAVRVSYAHSPRLILHVMACGYWFQAAVEKCLFKRRRNLNFLQPREIVFEFSPSLFSGVCTVLDHFFWVRLGALKKCCVLMRWECLPPLWITIRRAFFNTESFCRVWFTQLRASHLAIASSCEAPICLCGDSFPCQVGFVNGNPSGSRLEIRSRKPLWKSGSSSAMNLLMDRPL